MYVVTLLPFVSLASFFSHLSQPVMFQVHPSASSDIAFITFRSALWCIKVESRRKGSSWLDYMQTIVLSFAWWLFKAMDSIECQTTAVSIWQLRGTLAHLYGIVHAIQGAF